MEIKYLNYYIYIEMRLNNDNKNDIFNSYNNKESINDTIKKYNISKATYYRIIKDMKDKSNNSDILTINNDINETENETENDNETEKVSNDTENETENDIIIENDFNKDEFKKQLNTESENEEVNFQELEIIKEEKSISEKSEPIKKNIINIKPVINDIDTSMISNVSFKPMNNNKKNIEIINKSTIIDTIKNVNNAGTVDELKEKRHLIIIIRQYINTFTEELKNIYINKSNFEKKLFTQSIEQLKIILEDIRISLNLTRNKDIFFNCVETGLRGFETMSNYSGYDINGLTDDLMKDPDFMMDLKIISCEIDMSQYINPKSSAFLKIVKTVYQKNQENKIKNQINKVINDKDKLQKIINLDKKI